MNKCLVILGPTATGKTDLALDLAKKLNGELVSADSRQVYVGLDIGTGKLPGKQVQVKKFEKYWEMDQIKVWMLDVIDPKKRYDVAQYMKDTSEVLEKIIQKNKLPIVVGGTGFYLKSIIHGLSNLSVPANLILREELEKLSLEELQNKLKDQDIKKWNSLNQSDQKNPRRLIRAIELVSMYGYVEKSQKVKVKSQKYNYLIVGLTAPRAVLNNRIDDRIFSRFDQGMIEEVKDLHKKGLSFQRMKELGLEYREISEFLEGKVTKKQMIENLKNKIHQYAKRQMTWFKKEEGVNWFDITNKNYLKKVEKCMIDWYNG